MNLTSLLFGFEGRINRKRYWLGVLIVVPLSLAIVFSVILLVPALFYIIFAVGLVTLVCVLALAIKRLHDRNKSGWWALPFIVIPGILDRLSDRIPEETPMWWAIVLIAAALSLWGLIEIGFRKGTAGDNAYGPDPLAPAPAPGSA